MSIIKFQKTGIAIAAIIAADLLLTLNDAFIKLAQSEVGLWAVFWLRSLVAVPLLLVIVGMARNQFRPKRLWLVLARSLLLLAGWVCLYRALATLPLANAVATLYTIPILMAFMVAILDRIVPKPVVLGAAMLGFLGVLLIAKPGASGFDPAYGLTFLSAVTYCAAMILTNRRLTGEDPFVLALFLNLAFMAMGLGALLFVGTPPLEVLQNAVILRDWEFAAMGICIGLGAVCVAVAYQKGPAPLVAIFDYVYLPFAIIWGFVFFGDVPDVWSQIGMVCIAASGIWVISRSR